ncbi:hypothetical protein EV665_1527 [Shinella granuli]|uniref:Uncharacterized protein n=1 Tax=Shinella granuli TaxID=323621 RepID=A0A4R2BV19_SHIGR|nr:hypothetical protein EV665_1527 [Shinella granuli]
MRTPERPRLLPVFGKLQNAKVTQMKLVSRGNVDNPMLVKHK